MGTLRFDQKRLLAAFECFLGEKYKTPHTTGDNNTSMHVEAQKMCYLLKLIGIEIGDFSYSWNSRGPFSPGLLVLLRSIDSCHKEVDLFYKKSEEKEKYLKNIKSEIEDLRKKLDMDGNCSNSEPWIEILGSLAYLSRTVLPGADFECVSSYLKKRKEDLYTQKTEFYNDEKNKKAWDLLIEAGLIKQIA